MNKAEKFRNSHKISRNNNFNSKTQKNIKMTDLMTINDFKLIEIENFKVFIY